jgi:hypothetical protein
MSRRDLKTHCVNGHEFKTGSFRRTPWEAITARWAPARNPLALGCGFASPPMYRSREAVRSPAFQAGPGEAQPLFRERPSTLRRLSVP